MKRKMNYSVIECECLVLVFPVKIFRNFLYGKECVLKTDHQPLSYMKRCQIESPTVMRWALFLQSYRYKVETKKESMNIDADCMVRLVYTLN